MPDGMTKAVRDDLAKLAYALARGLPKEDAKALLGVFARERDLSDDMAWALFVRGKDLARRAKERAA
jgi:hypothetical protein